MVTEDDQFNALWTAFESRVLDTCSSFPRDLSGTLVIEVWAESGETSYRSIEVDGPKVRLSDGLAPNDTACMSVKRTQVEDVLGAHPSLKIPVFGDVEFARALLSAVQAAPPRTNWLGVRSSD